MKICTKCKQPKPLSEYFIQSKVTGKIHAQCKACYKTHRKTYLAEHYRKYGDQYRERAKKRRAMIKRDLQIQMLEYLQDKSCEQCGENDLRVLDFDHLDPTLKSFSVARGLTNGYSWGRILAEINKCRILCANCHHKHTTTQNGSYKLPILE